MLCSVTYVVMTRDGAGMGDRTEQLTDPTTTGAELFGLWIDAGAPKYPVFAHQLAVLKRYRTSTTALSRIKAFAAAGNWQARKLGALTAAAELDLQEAAALDANSFLNFSRAINERSKYANKDNAATLVPMRESVRRKTPIEITGKDGGPIQHEITVLDAAVRQIAAERGLDPADVLAEAERIMAEGREVEA